MSQRPIPGTRLLSQRCGGPPRGSLFGLAPDGVFRAASLALRAVRPYRTFSPLPMRLLEPAVCFLWHCPSMNLPVHRPRVSPAKPELRGIAPFGVRTFLRPAEAEQRSSAFLKSRTRYPAGAEFQAGGHFRLERGQCFRRQSHRDSPCSALPDGCVFGACRDRLSAVEYFSAIARA